MIAVTVLKITNKSRDRQFTIEVTQCTLTPNLYPLVAPYVKVYLMEGKNCKEKQKTNIARRTLDPLYQQQLYFTQPYGGCILQVIIFRTVLLLHHIERARARVRVRDRELNDPCRIR